MSSAEQIGILSFQYGLQDGYLSSNPHVKGGLFPLNENVLSSACKSVKLSHRGGTSNCS